MNEAIVTAMTELDDDVLYEEVKKAVAAGAQTLDILADLQQGMTNVGDRFANQEYYLSELILSAEMFSEAEKLLGTDSAEGEAQYGTFLMGTVQGDIHDIGKNIVNSLMRTNGFRVVDIGVDVPASEYVQAIQKYDPKVIGMSCLLTTAFPSMKATVDAIREAGLDKGRLLLIGGGPVDQSTLTYSGADGYCPTAQDTVRFAQDFVGVK